MRAGLVLSGSLILSACGGGGTTGTNYSEAPPVATIVATPSPKASEAPVAEAAPEADDAAPANEAVEGNAL